MNRGNAKQSAPGHGPTAAIADYDRAIEIMQVLRATMGEGWPIPWRNDLAAAFMVRGNARQDAPGYGVAAAIADYDHSIEIRQALRESLGDAWPVSWRNDLAAAFMNRGNAKQSAPGHGPEAAIADFNRTIEIMQALRDSLGGNWPIAYQNGLAAVYLNRGIAKVFAPGWGLAAAIADFDRAIEIREALRAALGDDWPIPWRNDHAAAFMNRGNAKQHAPGHGPEAAIADCDRAIAIREALREAMGKDWPTTLRNNLAETFANRGNAKYYTAAHGPVAAIVDCDCAIEIMQALRATMGESWPMPWRNSFAGTYSTRGIAKASAPGWGPAAAVADFDSAIEIREALREALGDNWPTPWRNDLATVIVNRGVAKQDAPGHGAAAIADYDRAIALWEALERDLGAQMPPVWRGHLATARQLRTAAKDGDRAAGP